MWDRLLVSDYSLLFLNNVGSLAKVRKKQYFFVKEGTSDFPLA